MNFQRHSFPDFQDSKPAPLKENRNPRALFKPTFQHSCDQNHADEINRVVEQAHQQSYASGMAEGREEGCRLAQSALSPCLNQFGAACENMTTLIPALAETMAEQVVALAHGICQRIMGSQMALQKEDLDRLQTRLVAKMVSAYRLVVHIHPDDFSAVESLAASVNFNWPDGHNDLSFIKDPEQPRGQLTLQVPGNSSEESPSDLSISLGVEDLADFLGESGIMPPG